MGMGNRGHPIVVVAMTMGKESREFIRSRKCGRQSSAISGCHDEPYTIVTPPYITSSMLDTTQRTDDQVTNVVASALSDAFLLPTSAIPRSLSLRPGVIWKASGTVGSHAESPESIMLARHGAQWNILAMPMFRISPWVRICVYGMKVTCHVR